MAQIITTNNNNDNGSYVKYRFSWCIFCSNGNWEIPEYFTVWNKTQSSWIQCSEGCIILHSWVPMVWLTVNSISSLLQSKEFRTKWFPEAMVIVSIMTESSFNTQVDLGSFLFTRICSTCFSGRSPSHCPATVERVRQIDIKKHYMKHYLSIHLR